MNNVEKKIKQGKRDSGLLIRSFIVDNFKPGEMIPGEAELINSLNVSRYSVLKELTSLVAEGVVERRQGCGTFMSKRGSSINSHNIAFIANEFEAHMNIEIMRGVDDYLRDTDFNLVLLNSNFNKECEVLNLGKVRGGRFGGVLAILDPDAESLKEASSIIDDGIPFVQIDRSYNEINAPIIESSHQAGAYKAVAHLIAMGHTNIAHITFVDPEYSSLSSVKQRYLGYKQALEDHGIEFKEDYVKQINILGPGRKLPDCMKDLLGYESMHKLLSMKETPTAVFLLNDSIAKGVYKAINNHGLEVGKDVSVIGFDNDISAQYLNPPLTTVEQAFRKIGNQAMQLLEEIMEGKSQSKKHIEIHGELIIRDSVRRLTR